MHHVITYAAILLPFGLLDAVWLSIMGRLLYRPTLGDILLPGVNIAPAVAFYLIYPIGILVFATLPALKAGSVTPAIVYGTLFGALAYATYDLTNHATLRNWTLQLTLVDMAWGAFATSQAWKARDAAAAIRTKDFFTKFVEHLYTVFDHRIFAPPPPLRRE